MNGTQRKVVIKLAEVGNQREAVLAVLSKIQGLRDTPEQLIADVPCYISGKVPLTVAEKAKWYLERAGAVVELEDEEVPGGVQDVFPSSFDRLQQQLTTIAENEDSASYEATEVGASEETVTLFSADTLPHTPTIDESQDYHRAYIEAEPVETIPDEGPAPKLILKQKRRRQRTVNAHTILTAGIGIGIAAIVGIGIWMYFSGRLSHFTQQYVQNPVGGQGGALEIENTEGADLKLYRVRGTRVFEQIPLEGSTTHLPWGDYYVEAQKGMQILHYPVYIQGRRHRVMVIVSFSTQPIANNMAYIPAGWFRMGNKETEIAHFGFPDEKPDIDVYVGAFLMSKYEVTNWEYAQFVKAGGYKNKLYWEALIEDWDSLTIQVPAYKEVYGNDGWNSVNKYIAACFVNTDGRPGPRLWEEDTPPYEDGQDDHPVLGITLYEADAYCQWLSQQSGKVYRLPTEAEWEKAARGYEGYFFSYGNEYDPTRANTEVGNPTKVGSYPPNGYGVYDLTGNVWEWISDHYRADAYQYLHDQSKGEIRNPRVFDEAKRYDRRIVRGGSFRSVNRINAKTTVRYPMFPNYWHTNIGFRYVTMP